MNQELSEEELKRLQEELGDSSEDFDRLQSGERQEGLSPDEMEQMRQELGAQDDTDPFAVTEPEFEPEEDYKEQPVRTSPSKSSSIPRSQLPKAKKTPKAKKLPRSKKIPGVEDPTKNLNDIVWEYINEANYPIRHGNPKKEPDQPNYIFDFGESYRRRLDGDGSEIKKSIINIPENSNTIDDYLFGIEKNCKEEINKSKIYSDLLKKYQDNDDEGYFGKKKKK